MNLDPETAMLLFGAVTMSRPLTKLVEAVFEHVGLERDAARKMKNADAERYEAIQQQLAKENVADVKRMARMQRRITNDADRRQGNREKIVRGAAGLLPGTVSDRPVDQVWISRFFCYSEDEADAEMLSIWSQLLAGEVAEPGRYSLRTLQAVSTLRKEDAILFTNYCKFVWWVDQWSRPWFFISAGGDAVGSFLQVNFLAELRDIYTREGVTPEGRLHLQALNLVSAGGQIVPIACTQTEPLIFHYHDRAFAVFDTPERPVRASPPYAPEICSNHLTDIGRELAPICGAKPHDRYRQLILDSMRCNQLRIADMT
jgi:hypothetical protein